MQMSFSSVKHTIANDRFLDTELISILQSMNMPYVICACKEVPNFFPISHMQTLLLFHVTLSSLAYTVLKESALKYHPVNSENSA